MLRGDFIRVMRTIVWIRAVKCRVRLNRMRSIGGRGWTSCDFHFQGSELFNFSVDCEELRKVGDFELCTDLDETPVARANGNVAPGRKDEGISDLVNTASMAVS